MAEPMKLIAGDFDAGFFGEVSASELFTASQIAVECNISQGTAINENEQWLKFASNGKVIYVPRKPIRQSISWGAINIAGCVYGDKTVSKNGVTYNVRLMRGAFTDPSNSGEGSRGAWYSEWNKLILGVHGDSINRTWLSGSNFVESDIAPLHHNFGTGISSMYNDGDLGMEGIAGGVWCQETTQSWSDRSVRRLVAFAGWDIKTSASGNFWMPVLEREMLSVESTNNKHLIKSSNKIQVLDGVSGTWTDTLLTEPLTKADFETHGMDSLSEITDEKLQLLEGDEFEIITWTDEEGEEKQAQLQGQQSTWSHEGKLFEIAIGENEKIKNITALNVE